MQTNKNLKNENNSQNGANKNAGFCASLFGAPTSEKASGIAFSLAALLPQVLAIFFLVFTAKVDGENPPQWYLYFNYLLPQISFVLVALFYFRYTKKPVQTALQKQKCKGKYYLIAVLLQFGLLSLSELNGLFLQFLGNFGYQDSGILLPSLDGFGFFGVLFVVAVLPAVLEETIFRGVLFSGLHSFGKVGAVFLCGGLFALYHQNPAQTLYQFCCGAAFALIALKAGSILPTVLAHFLNNAAILLLAKLGVEGFSSGVALILLIISALSLVGTIVYLCFFDKGEKWGQESKMEGAGAQRKQFLLSSAIGIVLCALTWILVLISGI